MEETAEAATASAPKRKQIVLKSREAVEARDGSKRAAYNKRRRAQRKWAKWGTAKGDSVDLPDPGVDNDGLDAASEE